MRACVCVCVHMHARVRVCACMHLCVVCVHHRCQPHKMRKWDGLLKKAGFYVKNRDNSYLATAIIILLFYDIHYYVVHV